MSASSLNRSLTSNLTIIGNDIQADNKPVQRTKLTTNDVSFDSNPNISNQGHINNNFTYPNLVLPTQPNNLSVINNQKTEETSERRSSMLKELQNLKQDNITKKSKIAEYDNYLQECSNTIEHAMLQKNNDAQSNIRISEMSKNHDRRVQGLYNAGAIETLRLGFAWIIAPRLPNFIARHLSRLFPSLFNKEPKQNSVPLSNAPLPSDPNLNAQREEVRNNLNALSMMSASIQREADQAILQAEENIVLLTSAKNNLSNKINQNNRSIKMLEEDLKHDKTVNLNKLYVLQ